MEADEFGDREKEFEEAIRGADDVPENSENVSEAENKNGNAAASSNDQELLEVCGFFFNF